MTIEDIKEFISKITSDIYSAYYNNYGGLNYDEKEVKEIVDKGNKILSMLDQLDDEKPNAHWEHIPEKNTPWAVQYFRCSNCLGRISVHGTDNGFGYDYNVKEKHCPHCGAKMEPYKEKE